MKSDEEDLWMAFPDKYPNPREAGIALDIPTKRILYLCKKWSKQKKYNYGISLDLGWKEV
jgi:hypothetical protein